MAKGKALKWPALGEAEELEEGLLMGTSKGGTGAGLACLDVQLRYDGWKTEEGMKVMQNDKPDKEKINRRKCRLAGASAHALCPP
jgi:hypothetical protein